MNKEEVKYIINHYSHLLAGENKSYVKEVFADDSEFGSNGPSFDFNRLTTMYRAKGWLLPNEHASEMLKDGVDGFELKIAERILKTYGDQVFMNYCPRCGKLARTPLAKQCRCGNNWHRK